MFKNVNIFKLLASVLLCQLAGVIGSIFTSSSLEDWYLLLEKPPFSPPSWVFFPVWTALYTLMGISLSCFRKGTAKFRGQKGSINFQYSVRA